MGLARFLAWALFSAHAHCRPRPQDRERVALVIGQWPLRQGGTLGRTRRAMPTPWRRCFGKRDSMWSSPGLISIWRRCGAPCVNFPPWCGMPTCSRSFVTYLPGHGMETNGTNYLIPV